MCNGFAGNRSRIGAQILILLLLGSIVVLLNINTFDNDWTFDDRGLVVENPDVLSLENFFQNKLTSRPVRELSYMVDYKIFGFNPRGFHIQQVLWHTFNGFFLYLLMARIGLSKWASIVGALFFLVHPVQVESVASIGHRKELLPLFFAFFSLFTYLAAGRRYGVQRLGLLLLSALMMIVAFLSNATAGPFPLLIVLYELFFLPAEQKVLSKKKFIVATGCFLFVAAGSFYLVCQTGYQENMDIIFSQNISSGKASYPILWLGSFSAIACQVQNIVWPVWLAPLYSIKLYDSIWHGSVIAGASIVIICLVGFVVSLRQKKFRIAFGLAWIVLMYLPVSNFYPLAFLVADRYLYMVMPGVSLLVAAVLDHFSSRGIVGKVATVISLAIIVILASLTYRQNDVWQNDVTLYMHAVDVSPMSADARFMLGSSLLSAGRPGLAKVQLQEALQLNPFLVSAYRFLGEAEHRMGNSAAAMDNFRKYQRYSQLKGGR